MGRSLAAGGLRAWPWKNHPPGLAFLQPLPQCGARERLVSLARLQIQPASLGPAGSRADAHSVFPLFGCLGEEHRNRRATSPNRFLAAVHLATRSRGASAPPNPEPARTFFAEQLERRARPGSALV